MTLFVGSREVGNFFGRVNVGKANIVGTGGLELFYKGSTTDYFGPYIEFKGGTNGGLPNGNDYAARLESLGDKFCHWTGGVGVVTRRDSIEKGYGWVIGRATGSVGDVLKVCAESGTSSYFAVKLENSSGTTLLSIRGDGLFNTGTAAASPYNNTTGASASLLLNSNGYVDRDISSRRYKTDIVDSNRGLKDVLSLRSVIYKDNKSNDGKIHGGLIAEEVHDLGLTEYVSYNKENQPDSLHYAHMIGMLAKAIQEFKKEVDDLKDKITAIEESKL